MEEKLRFTRETLGHLLTLEDAALFATTMLFSVIPADKVALAVIEGNLLRSVNTIGERVIMDLNLDRASINSRTVKTGRTQLVNDTRKDPDYFPGDGHDRFNMLSELCVPLIHRGKVLGTINFESRRQGAFSERDAEAAEAFTQEIAEAVYRLHGRWQYEGSPALVEGGVRSPMEVERDLLRVVLGGETVLNRILNRTAVQWKRGKELVDDLVARGLLVREGASARRYVYRVTEEGVKLLEAQEDVSEYPGE